MGDSSRKLVVLAVFEQKVLIFPLGESRAKPESPFLTPPKESRVSPPRPSRTRKLTPPPLMYSGSQYVPCHPPDVFCRVCLRTWSDTSAGRCSTHRPKCQFLGSARPSKRSLPLDRIWDLKNGDFRDFRPKPL